MDHARLGLAAAAVAAALAGSAGGARADLMSICAPEIGRYCADVSEGRGRISACLVSHGSELSGACLADVQSAARSRLIPSDMRKIFQPGFSAPLPAACSSAAARFCPEVAPGDGRVFACLYSRTDRVGAACAMAAEAALKAAN